MQKVLHGLSVCWEKEMSRGKKDFDLTLPEMSGEHRTLQGQVPGTVKTAGQFQVWAQMSIETIKEDQRKFTRNVTKRLEALDAMVCHHESQLQQKSNKDNNQEEMLKDIKEEVKKMKSDVSEQGKFVSQMKKSHAASIKVLTMVGGSLLSVLGSLLIWMLTKR